MDIQNIPLSEARRRLTELIVSVSQPNGQPVLISALGKPAVALISLKTYEDYLKTKHREEFHEIFNELDDLNKDLANKK